MNWSLKKISLELKVTWKISRNSSQIKENFILSNGRFTSEIAPNIRYGETVDLIQKQFEELKATNAINSKWCNSFKNAVANVLLKEKCQGDICSHFSLSLPASIETSYSIPIMEPNQVESYLKEHSEFNIFKLKVSDLESKELLLEVLKHTDKKLRIDANEGFSSLEEFLDFEKELKGKNIEFIEQPFKASMQEEYRKLKKISPFPIIADESVENDFHPEVLKDQFHGINIKLMKAGGIERAYELIQKAKAQGLSIMLGCMIESSLGILEAYYLSSLADYVDLDGALLTKNDPYKELFELENGYLRYKKSTP